MTKTVPRVIAHKIPRVGDPCYKMFMLAHFKAFDAEEPLVHPVSTVHTEFQNHAFSPRARMCMSNWEALYECEDERDAEQMKKRQSLMKNSPLLTHILSDNLEDLVELPASHKASEQENKVQFEILHLAQSNWFRPVHNSTRVADPVYDGLRVTKTLMTCWKAQIAAHENIISAAQLNAADGACQVNADDAALPHDTTTDAPDPDLSRPPVSGMSGGICSTGVNISDVKDVETFFRRVSHQFKLNDEQNIAFTIMAKTFALRKTFVNVDMDTLEEPFPLHMFIMGPGGMGKTHVIKALMAVMKGFDSAHALRFLAPTGLAAALNNGMTIHKAFGLSVCDRASKHSMQTVDGKEYFRSSLSDLSCRCLETNFKDVEVLVIDEVSLLQQELLPDIEAGCRYGKDIRQWWFGGMMVIFTGDLYQFPPVQGSAVYSRIKEHTAIDKRNLSKRIGRLVWNSMTDVVYLHHQKRMERDPDYAAAVQWLCLRQCSPEDVCLFNEHIVKTFDYQCGVDMDGVEAIAVVRTNLLCHSINSYKAMSNCSTENVITCCATDTIGRRLVPEKYRADLLNRDVSRIINKGGLHG